MIKTGVPMLFREKIFGVEFCWLEKSMQAYLGVLGSLPITERNQMSVNMNWYRIAFFRIRSTNHKIVSRRRALNHLRLPSKMDAS